ncbi:MAG: phage tail tape measure protein [Roseburia sp.]|nr:phage tail tape measure protein [Roseburia sp.]
MSASEKEVKVKISGKVDNSLNAVSQKVDKAFSKMTKLAKTATLVGGSAAAAALTGAVQAGSSFESQMSTVEAISGATATQIEQLEKKAKEMGATTKFTATESGQAMEYMAMAGWKTNDMLNGISGIMDLASASGEDLASTADIVTDALTAFGLQAKDSGHFADILAQASSNSNTNVSMMGETFKYVAPIAGSLGYTAEDAATSIGLMANAGIKSSQAGTTLRKIMTETAGGITLVSKAYAKAGEKTGKYKIETANADGSMKEWSTTVDSLREQFSKMTEEEQAANAESIAGKTAMSGLLAIVNASEKDYKKLTNSINNASGAAKRMADVRMDNLQGDVTIFQSALEGKGIELYEEIKEPLRDIVQNATDWLEEIDIERVVDDFENFGEAVLDFAEPLLDVGEWMIENPDAIATPLAGIGSTIAGYKLLDTVPKLASGLKGLAGGLTASPYIAGGALAVGALTGVAVAIDQAEQAAANASLDEHFGDIALSMDQIQRAADDLIGSKTLENMEELMNSIKISKSFEREMKKASESIKKIEWKISAGLELDDEDMEDLNQNVQDYVQSAQEQIDQQGYTVNVATNILFGDSEKGKELIQEDNAFFGALKMEADGLAARINNTLEEAMKKGLTPDLKEALDRYLEELGELTRSMADAETEASWDILSADYSGKELDADSFQRMQDKVNENIEKVTESEKEARDTIINNARKKFAGGYISEEERQVEVDDAEKQYEENIKKAKERGLEFQYNTLMDTYGEDLMSGNMSRGDKNAVHDMVLEMQKEASGKLKEKLEVIEKATSGTYITDFVDEKLDKLLGDDDTLTDSEKAMSKAGGYAEQYMREKGEYSKLPLDMPGIFAGVVPLAISNAVEEMEKAAKDGGLKSGEAFGTALMDEIAKMSTINIPVNFSLSSGAKNTNEKEEFTMPRAYYPPGYIPGHAEGTISAKAHIAAVSEGNKMEAIIPINTSERSRRLYEATGKLLGYNENTGGGVTFAPTINITLNGDASEADGKRIRKLVGEELKKQYRKMLRDDMRFNMHR